jgi:hypothetical protein
MLARRIYFLTILRRWLHSANPFFGFSAFFVGKAGLKCIERHTISARPNRHEHVSQNLNLAGVELI